VESGVRIWCLRHGESANVVDGLCGAVPWAALTATGRTQATAAAAALTAYTPVPARVYTSTALRAVQTAEIIATRLGHSVRPVRLDDLVEVGIGSSEGAADPATRAETARVLHAWTVLGDLNVRVADGETGHQVLARMRVALEGIAEQNPGGTVALVGHVASLTAALSNLCGIGHQVWGRPLPHATPFAVDRHERTWRCSLWPAPAQR
jgi:alpha-ribazole phosphatase/probable phosphoglycerate mutase